MISIQRLNARGANKNGDQVVDYLMATEYYLNKDGQKEETTRWGGKLAHDPDLDLAGKPVSRQDMLQLAKGFSPTGEALCRNAGEEPREVEKVGRGGKVKLDKEGNPITKLEGGHRVGFDLTFSAPKPFSVAFAIADATEKDLILEAHRKAVAVGMGYLESKVETRRGKAGIDVIDCEGLIYMQADHLSSRNMDANLHTHNLVFGVSKGAPPDNKWGTFDALELYRHRLACDAVYKNELAMNMRELGYGIEQERQLNAEGRETGRVLYKVNGISDDLCKTFSSRREEILLYQEEFGVDAQTACLATRRHKEEPSYAEMSEIWTRTMAAMPEGSVPTSQELKQLGDKMMAPCTPQQLLEKLHQNEAVFCDHNLIDCLGQEYAGTVRFDELIQKVEDFKQTMSLVEIHGEKMAEEDKGNTLSRRNTETRYAAKWMVEWENEVIHRVESRKNEEHQRVEPAIVEKAIAGYEKRKGFTLTGEQREAVENITGGAGVAVLQGFAGTGKTTVSDCYSDAFRAQGKNMLGVCVSNKAAIKLEQESGMPCMSVSKMLGRLDRDRLKLTDKDVLVVDEAGMIDTNQTRRLLSFADAAGVKIIVQGDLNQLQAIGAGSGLALVNSVEEGKKLTQVRRQKFQEDRDIALKFYPRNEDGSFKDLEKGTRSRRETLQMGGEIMKALDARGCLDDYDTQTQAIEALVDDYLKSPVPVSEKLVLGHARLEVAALNNGIREGLKEQGELDKSEIIVRAMENSEWTELALAKGDRIRITGNNEKMGLVNGNQGILLDCVPNKEKGGADLIIRIQALIEGGKDKTVSFNTEDFPAVSHNYAITVHKSQGAGKEQIFHLANQSMIDNHSMLVAFTRLTKGDYRLYGSTEDIERLGERCGRERLKGNAITEGIKNETRVALLAQVRRADHEEKAEAKSLLMDDEKAIAVNAAMSFKERLGARREQQGHDNGAALEF